MTVSEGKDTAEDILGKISKVKAVLLISLLLGTFFIGLTNPNMVVEFQDQLNREKVIDGNITGISQYVDGSLFSTSTIWVIEMDNSTIIKSREFNDPYLLSIGDYIRVTLYAHSFSEDYASNIELLKEGSI